jgi:CMP-N-acetylneuraminic acid synthetase
MKITALIPFWMDYKPLKSSLTCRSLIEISGKSLISRTIEITNHIKSISKTAIFTSNSKILDYIDNNVNYEFVQRSSDLDSDKASIEDIIDGFLQTSDADIIVLIHPKSPFIKPQTIEDCIQKVLTGRFDSALIVNNIKKHAWYKGRPLNYLAHGDTPEDLIVAKNMMSKDALFGKY